MTIGTFAVLSMLISFAFADTTCPTVYTPNNSDKDLDYCSELTLPPIPTDDPNNFYESTDSFISCCFLEYELNGNKGTSCLSLTEEEVEEKDKALGKLITRYPGATGKITCEEDARNGNNYLSFNLVIYLLLIFIF